MNEDRTRSSHHAKSAKDSLHCLKRKSFAVEQTDAALKQAEASSPGGGTPSLRGHLGFRRYIAERAGQKSKCVCHQKLLIVWATRYLFRGTFFDQVTILLC